MPIDESSIRGQILKLKDFRRWSNKNELIFLPQLMEEEEIVKGLTSVLYKERKWLMILTDRKVIFLYRKMIDGIQESISLSDIVSVSCETGLMFARLILRTDKKEMNLESILKKDALIIKDLLSDMLIEKLKYQGGPSDTRGKDLR